ncbi:MAG TPA: TIGR02680 family protein [Pseudonocardia sp.]|nr:TIGR02680 family protein [Pseudonocardia sp.]
MTAATVASRASRNGAAGSRFRPSRAGVINLWDYRDEEFVFADGRLVLRGPNGSGKTKALEVLFPFVLDGRIEPRRLNPFASEDRTMKSNLLFRGQQSSYGYVWMEFAAAAGEAVTVGIGLQARKHADKVKRWYFVVDGRVGVDFSLLTPDERPLTRGQLIAEIGADAVRDNPGEHRAAVDARLFALGRERFEQLLTLVLTLRRPQLAKNLDPVKLSDTLSDGLRPLDDHLLAEAARSFDDMEAVARTLEGLARADEAATGFLTAYTTYLRSHARVAADAVTARRSAVTGRAGELAAASARLLSAQTERSEAGRRLHEADLSVHALRAQLDQLKRSDAYQAHEQLADLQRLVAELRESCASAQRRRAERTAARERAETHLVRAGVRVAELQAEAGRVAAELAADAAGAGIGWDVDAAASAGFAERVAARIAARHDDVQTVRAALGQLGRAEHARRSAAAAAERAEAAVGAAVDVEQRAAREVAASRSAARQRLADWADRHAATVAELGVSDLLEALAGTIDSAGEADATDPRTAFHRATTEAVQLRRDELARLRQQRAAVADEIAELERQQREIAAERDDSPAPFAARTADRAGRAGAPLWQLVRFAEQLDEADAAGLEAALEAANLLDAWIHPDDADTAAAVAAGDADGYLTPLPVGARPAGRTLGSVLAAEDTDLVDPARVREVLASIALLDPADQPAPGGPPSVSAGGRFGQGVQVGAFRKPLAGYIGATARARRRAARLAELDRSLADAAARLDATDRLVSRARSVLDAVEAAAAELPRLGAIVEALRRHDRAAGMLRATRESADAARSALDQAVAEVGARDRQLRRAAAERALDPEVIDDVAGALVRFERGAQRLTGVRRESAVAATAVEQETERVEQAQLDEERSVGDAERAEVRAAEETERLDVLQRTAGAAAAEVLALVARTEAGIGSADQARSEAAEAREQAAEAAARADAQVDAAATALRTARAEEQAEARRLAPFAEADVLRLLRCPPQLRWPARHEDWPDPEPAAAGTADSLPAAVIALHEAVLAATSELSPTEASAKQSATRLARALDELSAELSAAGHDYRPEWVSVDGIIIVRVADESGPAPAGAFGERIAAARRDQEQLLTESERRVLEDALLTQLARQIHERTVDARDLIGRMNTEMKRRRMSSGITVGVRWELADGLPDEHRGVVRLMERDAAGLGPDELARMRVQFAGNIKAARAAKPDRAYRELLGEVLDYRRWRSFSFFLHPPGGGEERLTRARHGQLSGGEQSVSLHLPLFAAAHAMLNSADPHCPRLLALDEAFAGVDDKGRTELFGLATEFDFDLIMTGYDLWATYATVPGAAHYDLSHSPAEHTVSALLMVWDGVGTDADLDGGLAAALGSPLTRRRPGRGTGLLDELEPGYAEPDDTAEE